MVRAPGQIPDDLERSPDLEISTRQATATDGFPPGG